jgi:hypothetical protein
MQVFNREEHQIAEFILNSDEDQDIIVLNIPNENFVIFIDCYEYIYDNSLNSVKMEEGWRIIKGDYK